MLARLFALSALVTVSVPMLACDAPVDGSPEFRAIVVTDGWGLHDPWHAPDVNSCEDYWNDRCVGLSAEECDILHQRYTCSSSSQGPLITDHYGDTATVPAEKTWRTFVAGQSGFSDATATPAEACALLPKEKRKECNRLAAIALAAPELLGVSPDGGIGVIGSGDLDEVLASDLFNHTLAATDWTVPALGGEGQGWLAEHFPYDEGRVVFVVPDGTVSVSSKDIILLRDIRCTMDKVELCVDVDVK